MQRKVKLESREIHPSCYSCHFFNLKVCQGLRPMNEKAKQVIREGYLPECWQKMPN